MQLFGEMEGIGAPATINSFTPDISRNNIVCAVLKYCPEYGKDFDATLNGGDASQLLRGIVRSLDQEILGLFWENKLRPNFSVGDLFNRFEKQPSTKYIPGTFNSYKSKSKNPKIEDKIIKLYQKFCATMYCVAEVKPTCTVCYHQGPVLRKREVIRASLTGVTDLSEIAAEQPKCATKCLQIAEVITGAAKIAALDIFQVVNNFPCTQEQYQIFRDTDTNFPRMRAAAIICTPVDSTIEGRHSIAVVRKDASNILVIDDAVVAEYPCDSWRALEETVQKFYDTHKFKIPVAFSCVERVAFAPSPVR